MADRCLVYTESLAEFDYSMESLNQGVLALKYPQFSLYIEGICELKEG